MVYIYLNICFQSAITLKPPAKYCVGPSSAAKTQTTQDFQGYFVEFWIRSFKSCKLWASMGQSYTKTSVGYAGNKTGNKTF